MTTFFIILFIVIGVNAAMMFFSLWNSNQKTKENSTSKLGDSPSGVHSIDLASSDYKKAV